MTIQNRIQFIWQKHRLDIGIALLIFLVAAVPRLVGLGTFLTADEKTWIERSYEFVRAFKDLRFNDMLLTTHPGVTVTWVSGLAITSAMFYMHVPFSDQVLKQFIVPAQFPIALLNALAIPVAYWLLKDITKKRWVAIVASLFMALDPFLVGYSRVIHVDALLASFMLLAMLAMVRYAQTGYSTRWLVTSAVLSALAVLTKLPAVFLLPFLGLLLLVTGWGNLKNIQWLKARIWDLVKYVLIIIVLFITIWPAMLFVPDHIGNALVLKRDIVEATSTPHDMTESYTLNAYHYPATLLTRTTPAILVLTLCAVVLAVWELRKRQASSTLLWLCLAYVFFFVIMMTIGAKKGDRYIMPVFPVLSIMAALVLEKLWRFRTALAALVALSLVIPVIHYHPYEIAYSDPFLPDNLSQELGWGEGLDKVGAWLNQNDPHAYVASWYPEELQATTTALVSHINAHEQPKYQYVVLYRNMFGRDPANPANDFIDEYYKKREPVFVAKILGKEFAWVYQKMAFPNIVGELLPDIKLSQTIEVTRHDLAGLDLFLATYSGRAKAGALNVTVHDTESGNLIQEWTLPVSSLQDTKWQTLLFTKSVELQGKKILVQIQANGTAVKDAPTIRLSNQTIYHTGVYDVSGEAKKGDLAIRLLYRDGEKVANEEQTKLLH